MQVFFSCQNCGHDLQADSLSIMPDVACPECGQYTPTPSTSTRTPLDQESYEATVTTTFVATTAIDEGEMPEDRETRHNDLRRLHYALDLNKRRKIQDSLSYSIVGLIIIAGMILLVIYLGGDPKGFTALCVGVLLTVCLSIGRSLYLLATTPGSITRAAFRDRDYWHKFFFISDKAPDDQSCGTECNNSAGDSQKRRQEDENSQRGRPRQGEIVLTFILLIATLLFSCNVLAPKLILIGHYGWAKVQEEHLHFLDMPKGYPWPVSNGDRLNISFAHYMVSAICWFLLFFPLYAALRFLLPESAKGVGSRCYIPPEER
jgi:hypothetical protein